MIEVADPGLWHVMFCAPPSMALARSHVAPLMKDNGGTWVATVVCLEARLDDWTPGDLDQERLCCVPCRGSA